jgi:serine/threonine-protein kinase
VPILVGLTEGQAARKLRVDAKLNVRVVDVPSLEPEGIVVRQSHSPGSTVPQGTTVTIWVSNGEAPVAPLPNFIGMEVDVAEAAAEEFEETTGVRLTFTVQEVENSNPRNEGKILETNPDAATVITESASVILFVGVLPEPGPPPDD